LVDLNGKPVRLKQPHVLDAVDHNLRRWPVLQISLAIEVAIRVPSQPHEGGIVAALGVSALARIQSQGLDLQVLGPGFEPEARVVKVARIPFTLFGVDRLALFSPAKGAFPMVARSHISA
jgi:hypothetical protein